MDFESLKKSSSNFDAITKALETKMTPENQFPNLELVDILYSSTH